MGLLTDAFFKSALESNADLMAALPAHAIYNNIADPDYDMENVAVPYIIVNNDGGNNDAQTKDDYEGAEDKVNISIRIVAKTNDSLRQMAVAVRRTVHDYMQASAERIDAGTPAENDDLRPYDYDFSFSDVAYEPQKPSHTIVLYYKCSTPNEIFDDNEQN